MQEKQYIEIDKIKLNPNNPRIIKDENFKKLVKSIKDFPEMLDIRPIVVNKEMIILWWNMRYKACKEAGLKEIPVIIADLSEEKQKEFLIKDNVSGGEWDMDMLANEWEIKDLNDWGVDIKETITPDEQKELIEDEVPEDPKKIIVEYWDIFQLWNHYLQCGDSMNEEDIKKLLSYSNSENITHCISDPPYWIAYTNDKHWMIKNDDKILDYTSLAKKYTNWFFAMWTGYQVVDEWIKLCKETFESLNNIIIWHKGGGLNVRLC